MLRTLSRPLADYPAWIRIPVMVIPLAVVAYMALVWIIFRWGPGDVVVYLAAGERLNDGHSLYALVPGDRPVMLKPPYWSVPLLSPPFIAVLWRPLAALPSVLAVSIWWLTMITATVWSVALLYRRAPIATGAAMLLLAVPVTILAGAGNVDALRLLGCLAVWWLILRSREDAAGFVLGMLIAVKLTPLVLLWWLILSGRRRAVIATLVTILASLVVSVAGAGLDAHLAYLDVARDTVAVGASEFSIAGFLRGIGVDDGAAGTLPTLVAAGIGLAMVPLRGRRSLTWAMAIVAMVVGSPAAAGHSFSLLLAALAPVAWPEPGVEVAAPEPGAGALVPAESPAVSSR